MESVVEFSLVKGKVKCVRKTASTLRELAEYASKHDVTFGIFNNDSRRLDNFLRADTIALDIDDGMPLHEAQRLFKPYKHAILTTKSHGIEKGGVVADRYRVILVLERTIDNAKDYYATWYELQKEFPFIDAACKDPSRFFYPSPEVIVIQEEGKTVPVVIGVDKPNNIIEVDISAGKGDLSRATLDFLYRGCDYPRHERLYKASRDAHEQGYTPDEFKSMVSEMIERTGNWGTPRLNGADEKTIDSAWSKEPRHSPRYTEAVSKPSFNWSKLGDLGKGEEGLSWVVDGLLTQAGLSILAGPPKSGKSTLTRQLTKSVLNGSPFLGRSTKKGRVLYLALEEQAALLKQQFKTVGIKDDQDLIVHVGSVRSESRMEELRLSIIEMEANVVVIDTLFLFAQFENGNSYDEVNKVLMDLRDVARETGAHLICIHHQNKGLDKGTNSIMGSSAIHGAVDCAIIFNRHGKVRSITSSQRGGDQFENHPLLFDKETETYCLGEKRDDGF